MTWAEEHDIEMKISPGQAHTRTTIVERRHQLLRKSLSIFMVENGLYNLDGLHTALSWTVPTLNQHTFVNGYTPMQLALGRQPTLPGLISDDRTGPLQLQQTEQERLRRRLDLKAKAQAACAQAEIDVKLRRAMLRQFTGNDEELQPGERCLYWRESGNRFHTIQWRGPAVVTAVQHDPDTGTVDTYWLAHGTVLIRAARQHVRRVVGDEGLVHGAQRAEQAIAGLRQRRVVRTVDLRRINQHSLEELEPELGQPTPDTEMTDQPQSLPPQVDQLQQRSEPETHEPDQPHSQPPHNDQLPQQGSGATSSDQPSPEAEPPPATGEVEPKEFTLESGFHKQSGFHAILL